MNTKTVNSQIPQLETDHTSKVLSCAILSRIILLSLIMVWRSLVSPYDTSASLNPDCISSNSSTADLSVYLASSKSVLFPRISSSIEKSIVWDSVYFVRIAECGYEYEQTYAFLPLLPIVISLLAKTVLRPLIPMIGYRAVLGLSGYVVNNVAFVLAAVYFYRLSVVILKDKAASLRASILFCFNPASIFYSSIYSESLYALLSIGGIYLLMSGANIISVFWFALSGSARSNGVLNAGYFCFQTIHQFYDAIFAEKNACLVLRVVISGVVRCICIFIPFIAHQAYGYYNICDRRSSGILRPWCKAKLPLVYNFIQSHYWSVGFLRYFQLKQLPNFLLASPILSLAVCSVYSYIKVEPNNFLTLGIGFASKEREFTAQSFPRGEDVLKSNADFVANKEENPNLRRRKISMENATSCPVESESIPVAKSGYYSIAVLPFLLHLGFMAATAFFVMHVQVATRFLSASPPLYWFASHLMASRRSRRWVYLLWVYSIAYILLGSLLFSNFYPFT